MKRSGLAYAGVEVRPDLNEQRLEAVEVLASLATGDFLGFSFLGGGTNVPEVSDVRRSFVHAKLGQKLVVV